MNLKELSKKLGLSQTTVSRALNGYPEVSEKTRARIQKAAAENFYSPNTKAKSLATGLSMAIGHVIPISTMHEMVNPVFADFITGAGESYSKRGYDMMLTLVEDGQEERVYRELKARGSVDGIIVHAPLMNDSRIALLQDIGLPFVVHGRASDVADDYNWLDINNHSAFYRATQYLLDLNHTRIALVNGLEDMDFAHRRRNGFSDALSGVGLTPDPALMFSGEMKEVFGFQCATEALDLAQPATAFLTSSMISAIGIRRAVHDRGLVLGKDVSILTHDDELSYLPNGQDVPLFTATRSSVRRAGRESAEMLLDSIKEGSTEPRHRLFEVDLVIGQSTGRCPKES
jgi:LacI family transcriptional regulator